MSTSLSILIVVLNHRTPALTLECVRSLEDTLAQFPQAHIVIVDNGSGDDSVSQFRTALHANAWGNRVEILALPKNDGYAAGNNAALRPALDAAQPPDYIWLLNSDTRVRPNALGALVTCMESNPHAGIVGSQLEDDDATPQRAAFRFPSIPGEWEANVGWGSMTRLLARWVQAPPPALTLSQTDWVPGASVLIRRTVLEQIGLLDERFFVYYEDVDFCLRARKAGWQTWYAPSSCVEHRVGASSGIVEARRAPVRMPSYWFGARRNYFLKHHGWFYTLAADSAWLLGTALRRLRFLLRRTPRTDAPHLWRDFFANSVWMYKPEHSGVETE